MSMRLYLRLALAGILGGVLLLATSPPPWKGLLAMAMGFVSLYLASRGIGREPGSCGAVKGPDFAADDPDVAALPSTTTTRLAEQVRQARERRREQG